MVKTLQFYFQKNTFLIIGIFPLIIFWLSCFLFGLPFSGPDDLFFTGASINLVEKGEFINPWIRLATDRAIDRYYLQPPFHGFTLALWLKIFGISRNSLMLYACFCCLIFSVAIALILRKYKFPHYTALLISIPYAFYGLGISLRMDSTGMAYLALGLWLLTEDKLIRYFLGFSFLGAAILSFLVTMSYAIPCTIAIIIANYLKLPLTTNKKIYITKRIAILGAAFIFIFTLFMIFINFNLFQFLSDLYFHGSLRRTPTNEILSKFLQVISVGNRKIIYGSLYILFFSLISYLIIKRNINNIFILKFIFPILIGVILNINLYFHGWSNIISFVLWLIIIIIVTKASFPKIIKPLIILLTITVFFINHSFVIISWVAKERIPEEKYAQLRIQARDLITKYGTTKKYLIDDVAARYIFDYHLPENAIDFNFSEQMYPFTPRKNWKAKPDNEIWFITPFRGLNGINFPPYPKAKLFGIQLNSIPAKPDDVIIVE